MNDDRVVSLTGTAFADVPADQHYSRALSFVLAREGGYVNHPSDPGGATNLGVTQRTYDHWRKRMNLPTQSVRNITHQEVESIYRTDYWLKSGCDNLSWPLCLVHFDTAVNMGRSRAVGFLQQAHGGVSEYLTLRLLRYIQRITKEHPASKAFAKGWANRVLALARTAGVPLNNLNGLLAELRGLA